MDTLETGLVSGHQRQGTRLIGKGADGHGEVKAGIGGCELLVDFFTIADDFTVDEVGFSGYETTYAPAGNSHLIDQLLFGRSDGLMDGDVLGQHRLVFFGVFAFQDEGMVGGEAVLDRIEG